MSEASKTPVVSPFIYLLNSFELASQSDVPAAIGYESKRRAVIDYVLQVERERTEALDRAQRAEEDRKAYWTALELLCERFPECQAIGDLPGWVDEQSSRIAELKKLLLECLEELEPDYIVGGTLCQRIEEALASSGQGSTEPSS